MTTADLRYGVVTTGDLPPLHITDEDVLFCGEQPVHHPGFDKRFLSDRLGSVIEDAEDDHWHTTPGCRPCLTGARRRLVTEANERRRTAGCHYRDPDTAITVPVPEWLATEALDDDGAIGTATLTAAHYEHHWGVLLVDVTWPAIREMLSAECHAVTRTHYHPEEISEAQELQAHLKLVSAL